MKSYLSVYWNTSIFTGEVIASLFFMLFFLTIKNSKTIKNDVAKITLIAFSTTISVFIGKGISNIMEPGASISFAFSLNLIITSIFFNQFQLVASILCAEVIGTVLAIIFFKVYKFANKTENILLNDKKTSMKNHSLNTLIQQVILVVSMLAISFYDFQNGLTPTNTDAIIKSVFIAVVIIVIVMVFANGSFIMLSPIIAFAELVESGVLRQKGVATKFLIAMSIHLAIAFTISFGVFELKEITWN